MKELVVASVMKNYLPRRNRFQLVRLRSLLGIKQLLDEVIVSGIFTVHKMLMKLKGNLARFRVP